MAYELDYDDSYDDDYPCDHEDHEVDVIEGRCRCYRCGESWWASEDEVLAMIDAQAAYARWEDEENRRQWWRDLCDRLMAPLRAFKRWLRPRPIRSLDDEIPF